MHTCPLLLLSKLPSREHRPSSWRGRPPSRSPRASLEGISLQLPTSSPLSPQAPSPARVASPPVSPVDVELRPSNPPPALTTESPPRVSHRLQRLRIPSSGCPLASALPLYQTSRRLRNTDARSQCYAASVLPECLQSIRRNGCLGRGLEQSRSRTSCVPMRGLESIYRPRRLGRTPHFP
ncbi:hypothetical protein BD626DRAFT_495675 [Schizophyllum amplum]|uniref:Uncharacterized protein n=1 Tax=Schizophyllum amplum TaxID=97359 RepID=A0A550CEC2_9AGAR|nr:hypothetical protein BD626DRAFT_495675 [Auriculariopsis ampla]